MGAAHLRVRTRSITIALGFYLSLGCMIERVGLTVRDPTAVEVTASEGHPDTVRLPNRSVTVDGDELVTRHGEVAPMDVHPPTYNAIGGSGFMRWEHGPSLPLSLQVDSHVTATQCLVFSRHGQCREGITVRTPLENIRAVHRVTRPNRAMGAFALGLSALLLWAPTAILASGGDPGEGGWAAVGVTTALALPPLVWGLWHLFAPSHDETLTVDTLRDRIDHGEM